ncbi:uncharacterized protein BP5553_02562 [Venustampulla echinocandica]|uniref:LicD/FKTN/FKRP nucleotidyltransferase domain-containing protein n=1 Tax=Venustampulla echinocandica TaxID=2656787 RepID=A0A370TRR7_9HELO|nr:uncharacterized protein BP5553_02562 [Venustampulla echinocandica]RDL38222.1 hypothetical protein BP5553_02562 [Venustampulla echinocandica]
MRLIPLFVALNAVFLPAILAAPTASPEDAPEGDAPAAPEQEEPPPPVDTKYFHEPGGTDDLGHYDIRYYTGEPVSYEVRGDTLLYLIRSYLTVFRENNVNTWIAHGTLLGWWWNGKVMPWDWDLDTQVSGSTLTWLGQNMNMTFHNYTVLNEDGTEEVRQYLLDVNPNAVERVRGNGHNVIDARWIDVRNGLFIDITGLSETNPSLHPGIWSCKNYHKYRTRDLYPLRETMFEGVAAQVPYSFDRILMEEYSPQALTKTKHLGHIWDPQLKEWIKEEESASPKAARAHIPRSLQGDVMAKTGLGNLLRALG